MLEIEKNMRKEVEYLISTFLNELQPLFLVTSAFSSSYRFLASSIVELSTENP